MNEQLIRSAAGANADVAADEERVRRLAEVGPLKHQHLQWCQWCRWYRVGTTFWPILEYPVSGSIELAAILEDQVSGSIALWPQSQYGASMILPPHPQNFLRAFGAAHTNLTLRRPKSGDGR